MELADNSVRPTRADGTEKGRAPRLGFSRLHLDLPILVAGAYWKASAVIAVGIRFLGAS